MKISVLLLLAMIFILTACSALDNFLAGESPAVGLEVPDTIVEAPDTFRILASFISHAVGDLPEFPSMFEDQEAQMLAREEWFEHNGTLLTRIFREALAEVNSSFAQAEFSIYLLEHPIHQGWSPTIHADVPFDSISDTDILYLAYSLSRFRHSAALSLQVELDLDNGNQLFIMPQDNIIFTASYREQGNETAFAEVFGWWSIAMGTIDLLEKEINWQGYVAGSDGNFNIRPLSSGPFE